MRIWEKHCYNNCNLAEFINEKLREVLVYGITPHQPLFFFFFFETIETFYFNAKKPIQSHQEPVTESVTSSLGCTLTTSAFERSNPWICAAMKSAAPQTPLGRLPVCRSNTTPFTWFSRVRLNPQRWQEQAKNFCCISFVSHYKIQTCLDRIYKTTLTIASKSYLHPITFHASHETQGCIGYCMHFFPELKSCEHRYFTRKTNVKKGALAVLSSDSMAHWFLIEWQYQDP